MKTSEFQCLLYEKFIGINSNYVVKQVSPEVDRAVSTFYAYCRGEQDFPIDLLGELIRVTDDPQFIEVFLKDTNFIVNRIPEIKDIKDHTSLMLTNMKRFGDLAETYEKSIADEVIDRKERRELKKRCRELITELVGFMESI
ncbi:MAG: phage regulatory CII family protein [Candidatus Marinimicrobia bacterium]|nr:phage regulatory CII family protein [Candidatus Neomarinimicrobiota bacterium]